MWRELTDKVDVPEVFEELLAVDGLHLVAESNDVGAALLAVHVPDEGGNDEQQVKNTTFRKKDDEMITPLHAMRSNFSDVRMRNCSACCVNRVSPFCSTAVYGFYTDTSSSNSKLWCSIKKVFK